MSTTFTVHFDGQFWCGVLERHENDAISAVRVVFGAEPTDARLMEYLTVHGIQLLDRLDAAPRMPLASGEQRRLNPKRAMREARKAMVARSASTASQEAIKLSVSANKKVASRRRSIETESQAFERRRKLIAKRKRRHRDS